MNQWQQNNPWANLQKNLNNPVNTAENAENLKSFITQNKNKIIEVLPKFINQDLFFRTIFIAIAKDPNLAKCTTSSFLIALLDAAAMGIIPNSPSKEAYIVPYTDDRDRTKKKATFQLSYKGLINITYRNPIVKDITVSEVCENDKFRCVYGDDRHRILYHEIPIKTPRGNVIGYYAEVRMRNGGDVFKYKSKENIESFAREKSPMYRNGSGPWKTDFGAMAKKTILKEVLKIIPSGGETIQPSEYDNYNIPNTANNEFNVTNETIETKPLKTISPNEQQPQNKLTYNRSNPQMKNNQQERNKNLPKAQVTIENTPTTPVKKETVKAPNGYTINKETGELIPKKTGDNANTQKAR